ncbi:MAG: shikimate dehydrogenase [Acuticoccus sp.]
MTTPTEGGLPLPISGSSRVYAILGDPIAQVGSPRVFNTLFRERGIDAVLVPLHVAPARLEEAVRGLVACQNLDGIIITVPHKIAVAHHVDRLGGMAQRIGAVNAIRREADGATVGENFDGAGCVIGLEKAGHTLGGKRAVLLGAGGAGSAVAHAFADAGVSHLVISDTDTARADHLVASLERAVPGLDAVVGPADPAGADIVVNCTPLGMAPGDPYPMDIDRLSGDTLVVDVVLKPPVTPFLKAAVARGCATQPGSRMLEGQAEAVARFFGVID